MYFYSEHYLFNTSLCFLMVLCNGKLYPEISGMVVLQYKPVMDSHDLHNLDLVVGPDFK